MATISLIIVLLLVAVDQLLKVIMNLWLLPMTDSQYVLIDGVFSFSYVTNKGAAWGMFSGNGFILIGVTLAAIVVIAVLLYKKKIKGVCYSVAAVMILAGGIGNLIDRVFRGYVIDYLRATFIDFPVFNFADCLITVGAGFLIVRLIIELVRDYKSDKHSRIKAQDAEKEIEEEDGADEETL